MNENEFVGNDLDAHGRALASGDISSVELVRTTLEAIDASQSQLNAFRYLRADAALAEAAQADRSRADGDRRPLLGVPVAIKDDVNIAGLPTTFGTRCERAPATQDCEMVRRLKAAGAVIVGKTHSSELGQWPLTGNPELGHTHNPWKQGYTPGGSSGGSAAAVAAGLVPAAMGSDGAGSVRIPAAWTNLVGIKPQRGRIPTTPEAEMFNGLTVLGPLARTVKDAALLFDAVAGPCSTDRHRPPPVSLIDAVTTDPGKLRIGLSFDIPFTATPTRLHPEVREATLSIAHALEALGHDVIETDPAYGPLLGLNFMPRALAALDEWRGRFDDATLLDTRTQKNADLGRRLAGWPLRTARKAEARIGRRIGRIFQRVDVILAPTTATPAPRVEALDGITGWQTDKVITAACPYTWPWNVTGWPSINIPAGFCANGLPLGAQLMGPEYSEFRLASLAAQLEQKCRWALHTPAPRWFDASQKIVAQR